MYYDKNEKGYSNDWVRIMKNTIESNSGRFSTSRMLEDYTRQIYIPLCNLHNQYYNDLAKVTRYNEWKEKLYANWNDIKIRQDENNYDDITVDAGNKIEVSCFVKMPNELIKIENIEVQAYYGKITEDGVVDDMQVIPMNLIEENEETLEYKFSAKIELKSGGDYGYTFRVIPKNKMILNSMNLGLIKWITE